MKGSRFQGRLSWGGENTGATRGCGFRRLRVLVFGRLSFLGYSGREQIVRFTV